MNPGSLPPLSQKARALLSAEREIPPQPELVRRRALLRARAALWHAQSLPHARAGLVSMWKRVRWLAIAALCATSAVAAWYVGQPTPTRNGASDVTRSALLSAEREIPPQPELVRRRALLRARAALWHAQSLPHARAGLVSMWKRVRWLAIAALCATSAVAAWYVGQPTPTRNGASDVT